jgi:hypothetical protein
MPDPFSFYKSSDQGFMLAMNLVGKKWKNGWQHPVLWSGSEQISFVLLDPDRHRDPDRNQNRKLESDPDCHQNVANIRQ